jgi:hypothetical protein
MKTMVVLVCSLLAVPAVAGDLEVLTRWMTGSFDSSEQASKDEAYFDIRLEMVPIWTEREDGPWLYVEQASAENLERPYRQRVYRLRAMEDGTFHSEVYSIPDPLRFAGHWKKDGPLSELTPDDLELREGCTVILRREKKLFAGGTEGSGCSSTLRGASYATSEVVVGRDRIESWDRGFSAAKDQVWGAEKGPYIFRRSTGKEK